MRGRRLPLTCLAQDQFEEVYKKVATGKEFATGVADFVHKRSAIEKEYARKLQALTRTTEKEGWYGRAHAPCRPPAQCQPHPRHRQGPASRVLCGVPGVWDVGRGRGARGCCRCRC